MARKPKHQQISQMNTDSRIEMPNVQIVKSIFVCNYFMLLQNLICSPPQINLTPQNID